MSFFISYGCRSVLFSALLLTLTACGDSGGNDNDDRLVGRLLDSAVSGVLYD